MVSVMIKGLKHNERQIRSMEVCNRLAMSAKNAVLFAISTVGKYFILGKETRLPGFPCIQLINAV